MKEKIKALLKVHGVSQNDLADALGLTYQTISIKVNGHKEFTRDEIMAIKLMFKLTAEQLDYIFFDTNDMKAK